jgi:hypothetical protein
VHIEVNSVSQYTALVNQMGAPSMNDAQVLLAPASDGVL